MADNARPALRAVIYCRISKNRDGDSLGVDRQERLCRSIATKLGATVVEVFVDNDVSATGKKPRPAWLEMLGQIKLNRFDTIIALDTDRLLRKPGDLEKLVELCDQHRVRVAYDRGGFDPRSGEGIFDVRVRALVDAEEVAKLKKRVNRKVRELAEAGKVATRGGDRPFGFEVDCITQRPAEVAIIRDVADRLLGSQTIRGICRDLNDRGITTTTGGPWAPQPLKRLMTSARIAGLREYESSLFVAEWDAVITRDQFVDLRAKLRDPARMTRHTSTPYLLTGGRAICGRCGAKLVGRRNTNKQRRYVCAKGPGFKGCGRLARLCQPVENLIVEGIFHAVDSGVLAAALAERDDRTGEALESLEVIERKLSQLAARWAADQISDSEWSTAGVALRARLDAAETDLAARSTTRALDSFLGSTAVLREAWPTLNIDRQRAIVSIAIEHVTILPNPIRGSNKFNSSLVVPTWRF